ncbi:MAG: GtrA family protein [Haloferacaceae archaeon]
MGTAVEELVAADRFGKFLSVGAIGAVLDLSVSSGLTLGGIPPEFAKLVGAECAIVLMFFVNDTWTFPNHGKRGRFARVRRLLRSNLVRSGGLVVQFLVVRWLTRFEVQLSFAGVDVWALLTFPIAILFAFLFNYVAESLVTWRVTADR